MAHYSSFWLLLLIFHALLIWSLNALVKVDSRNFDQSLAESCQIQSRENELEYQCLDYLEDIKKSVICLSVENIKKNCPPNSSDESLNKLGASKILPPKTQPRASQWWRNLVAASSTALASLL